MAPTLLAEWIGGKRVGQEWVGETRANGGPGNSWTVNLLTGHWMHGAGKEKGGDLISLYADFFHVKQGAAKEVLAERVAGLLGGAIPVLERTPVPPERPAEPIPEDAPPLFDHPKYGAATAVYRYGEAFWVARYEREGGKAFCPFTWRGGRWTTTGYPPPRPIYRLEELRAKPAAPVLVVEGEKCADAAAQVLRAYAVITWANGSQSVNKTDWTPLTGRDVVIWPDADEAGLSAAAKLAEMLLGKATRIRIITPPDGTPAGWDVADAIAEGWDAKRLTQWAAEHIRTVEAPPTTPAATARAAKKRATRSSPESTSSPSDAQRRPAAVVNGGEGLPAVVAAEISAPVSWQSLGLDTNEGGMPHATLANASQILQMHPDFKGRIWLDSFRGMIYHTLRGPAALWTDADSRRITARIQQQLRLPKFGLDVMQQGIQHAAECDARNSLTEWLDGLIWDEEPRLETWLMDTLGVEQTPYTMAIARNWPIAMVARAYVPGCKVDNMLVLEGVTGISKTSFLEVLGDPWYKSLSTAFGDKDFLQAIQGAWLVELADMISFSKREHTQILATLTIRQDSYRPSYGHYVENHPRVCLFAGTSENDEYLQDARGRRRFWPLRCQEIDLDALRAQREQIFAEAVHAYREGARWYEMPAQATDTEQLARTATDLWTDRILEYVDHLWEESKRMGRVIPISSPRILVDAIEVPLAKQGDTERKRVARILRENSWVQVRDTYGRRWKKVERRPP